MFTIRNRLFTLAGTTSAPSSYQYLSGPWSSMAEFRCKQGDTSGLNTACTGSTCRHTHGRIIMAMNATDRLKTVTIGAMSAAKTLGQQAGEQPTRTIVEMSIVEGIMAEWPAMALVLQRDLA